MYVRNPGWLIATFEQNTVQHLLLSDCFCFNKG